MPDSSMELLKGTLDILILKTLSAGALHGYGISRYLREATDDTFQVQEGALYPALRRLEARGLLESRWDSTDTGRDAKFYTLTKDGEAELERGIQSWKSYVAAMAQVLGGARA
ncbi:MAG: PadR family transcriptional regulator [Gemmatimonadota bacterium]